TLSRFWHSPPTTVAPAVVARPRSSSSGSAPTHGRSGRATLTRKARSRWTVSSSRGVSRDTVAVVPPSPHFTTGGSADQGRSPPREPTGRGLGAETGWSSPGTASTPGRPARRAPGVQERTSIGDGSLYCFTPARFLDGLRLRGRCIGVLLARI